MVGYPSDSLASCFVMQCKLSFYALFVSPFLQLTEACLFLGLIGCKRMDHGIIA